ncbi:hypothetical protein [Streptococcus suis]|uniref:hypothetical protein n=1 Tax=Streptococcus suis TaxID=1307 RepID=UPI00201A2DED|nr:hypothetical protein [Streptococcus suis]MCL4949479.1 hypothetical protein [Streptococcus suis]
MKKIALVLSCLVLFLPVGIEASELGDNSLQIDSSRIEVEKENRKSGFTGPIFVFSARSSRIDCQKRS